MIYLNKVKTCMKKITNYVCVWILVGIMADIINYLTKSPDKICLYLLAN